MRNDWFAKIPSWVLLDEGLTTYDKMVYTALSLFVDHKGRCFPTVKRLAEVCSASETAVKAALKRLEAAGIIIRKPRYDKGVKKSTHYAIASIRDETLELPDDPPMVATRPTEGGAR